jgi:hypothetical protein
MNVSQENYAERRRKPIFKGYILYDSIYIASSKWNNYSNGEEIWVARG